MVKTVQVAPIGASDVPEVAQFLHRHLNPRVRADDWAAAMDVSWQQAAPNRGFLLRDGSQVVGAQLAFYSPRSDVRPTVCNLGAFCVLEEYRNHSLRLVRAALGQPGWAFTDLSPSGAVVPLNRRLGFAELDVTTSMVPAVPWRFRSRDVSVFEGAAQVGPRLHGRDLAIFRDHAAAPAVHHLLIEAPDGHAYVMFRKDRRKGLPIFATLVHVSDREVLRRHFQNLVGRLAAHGALVLLVEHRVVEPPRWAVRLTSPRPRMARGLDPDDVDYLYSELAALSW